LTLNFSCAIGGKGLSHENQTENKEDCSKAKKEISTVSKISQYIAAWLLA